MRKQFFLFLLLSLAAAHGQQREERVAIIQTLDDRDSIGFSDLAFLTDKLRETAVNVLPKQQFGVMTTESIVAFLGSQENARKACNESSCLAELGRKVSADYVAQARIGRFGNDLTIKTELYNTRSGNLIGSFAGNSKDIYGLLALVTEKAPDLFKRMLPKEQPPAAVAAPAPPPPDTAQRHKVHKLIKDSFKKNKEEIQRESVSLSDADREFLYNKNRKTIIGSFGYAVLNSPYLGIGSFLQGNIKWGIAQSALVAGGFGIALARSAVSERVKYVGLTLVIVGLSSGAIAPFVYQNGYNKDLREALGYNNVSYSIDPLIVPRDGMPAVGLAFNGRF